MAKRKAQEMLRLGDNAEWEEAVTYEVRLSQADCDALGVPFTLQGNKGVVRGPADGAATMLMTGLSLKNDFIHSALSQTGTPSGTNTRISKHVLLRLYARDTDVICKDEYRLLEWVSGLEDWPEIKQFEFSERRSKFRVEAVESGARNGNNMKSDSDATDDESDDEDDVCSNALPPAHMLRCLTRLIAVIAAGTGYTDTHVREEVLQHLRDKLCCGFTEVWMHLGMDGCYLVEIRKNTPGMRLPWHEDPADDKNAEAEQDGKPTPNSEQECLQMDDDKDTATGEEKKEPTLMVRLSKTDCTRYDLPYHLRDGSDDPNTICTDYSNAVAISSAFLMNALNMLPPLDKSNHVEYMRLEELEMNYRPAMTKADIRAVISNRKASTEYTKYISKAELLSLYTAEGITANELSMMRWARTLAENPRVTHFRFESCASVGKFFVRPMDGEHVANANPEEYGPMPPSVVCRSTVSLCELLRTSSDLSETTKQVRIAGHWTCGLIVSV